MAEFVVKVSGMDGATIWQFTDPAAGQLWGRQVKLIIADIVQATSPFSIRLVVDQERIDDDAQLQEYTNTHEVAITAIRTPLRRPTRREYAMLAESIGNNYANQVWRLVAQGLTLAECIPTQGRMTANPLVLSLQSPYMEMEESLHYPSVLKTLVTSHYS